MHIDQYLKLNNLKYLLLANKMFLRHIKMFNLYEHYKLYISKRLTLIGTNTRELDLSIFNATDIKIYKSLPLCNLKLMEVVNKCTEICNYALFLFLLYEKFTLTYNPDSYTEEDDFLIVGEIFLGMLLFSRAWKLGNTIRILFNFQIGSEAIQISR